MIKIVKGTFGLRDGKTIRPVKAGDASISLDKEQEARLVRLGVAVYVVETTVDEKEAASDEAGKPVTEEPDEEELPELNAEDPVDDE